MVNPGGVNRMGGKPYPASFVFTSSKDAAIAGEAAPAMYTDSSAPHDLYTYIHIYNYFAAVLHFVFTISYNANKHSRMNTYIYIYIYIQAFIKVVRRKVQSNH